MEDDTKEISTEERISALVKAETYVGRLIHLSSRLMSHHAINATALSYYAHFLGMTIPPTIEKRIEEFLLNKFSSNIERLTFRTISWGMMYLLLRGCKLEKLSSIVEYLFTFQNENGGIGSHEGDVGRIPNTATLLSIVLPEEHGNETILKTYEDKILKACNFQVHEWTKDVSTEHALSYKGAHIIESLLKCLDSPLEVEGLDETVRLAAKVLTDMQLKNGAWTFLLHRYGEDVKLELSVPHITAMIVCPLCSLYLREKTADTSILDEELTKKVFNAIKRGDRYLYETQNEFGFWYAHNYEELSIYTGQCALALKKSLEVL